MKKILTLLIISKMLLALSACSGADYVKQRGQLKSQEQVSESYEQQASLELLGKSTCQLLGMSKAACGKGLFATVLAGYVIFLDTEAIWRYPGEVELTCEEGPESSTMAFDTSIEEDLLGVYPTTFRFQQQRTVNGGEKIPCVGRRDQKLDLLPRDFESLMIADSSELSFASDIEQGRLEVSSGMDNVTQNWKLIDGREKPEYVYEMNQYGDFGFRSLIKVGEANVSEINIDINIPVENPLVHFTTADSRVLPETSYDKKVIAPGGVINLNRFNKDLIKEIDELYELAVTEEIVVTRKKDQYLGWTCYLLQSGTIAGKVTDKFGPRDVVIQFNAGSMTVEIDGEQEVNFTQNFCR